MIRFAYPNKLHSKQRRRNSIF